MHATRTIEWLHSVLEEDLETWDQWFAKVDHAVVLVHAQQQIAVQKLALQLNKTASMFGMKLGLLIETESIQWIYSSTKLVRFFQVVEPDDMRNDNDCDGIFEDMQVICHLYAMGRMESIWGTDCLEFKLGRWLNEIENELLVYVT